MSNTNGTVGLPTSERRAADRAVGGSVTLYHRPQGRRDEPWRPAQVQDISPEGTGLVLGRRLEPGTVVELELHNTRRHSVALLAGSVQHVTRLSDDTWLMGCAFLNRLREEELAELL